MDTKLVDIIVVKSFQFAVLTFFTSIVFLWYSIGALIPFAIWLQLTETFASIFGYMIGSALGMVLVGAFFFYVAKIPGLLSALLGVGIDLIKVASASIDKIGQLANCVKEDDENTRTTVEVTLKETASN